MLSDGKQENSANGGQAQGEKMSTQPPRDADVAVPNADDIAELRVLNYNATLLERIDIHEDLARFRILPDAGVPKFAAGQYVALGLGYWEPRLPGTQGEELAAKKSWSLVRRAYSISCSLIDDAAQLLPCDRSDYLEFYVTLIRESPAQPPALTPRLFQLQPGRRLFVQPRVVGNYRLQGVGPRDAVFMLGTGTGEAPHNAMAAELLAAGHRGPIVVATCVRLQKDLGYRKAHQTLMARYDNYRYLWYTTRETRNLDATAADYVGLERLQQVYSSGRLAAEAGFPIRPQDTHVFLCGNPQMIGLHRANEPPPDPPGMLQLLQADGFRADQPPGPGQICYEKYW